MNTLFPEIEAYNQFFLSVAEPHKLYVEEAGNPNGQPVVFLHGGPGGGFSPNHRRLFDPAKYRIILLDQRGAGKSTPHASLENNTTWDLVADLEILRKHLNIERWLVFGGSWGSTLALAYAETHPEHVTGLILRGIFLCRPEEIKWFYQGGVDLIYPDLWEEYIKPIPVEKRDKMVEAYYELLDGPDEKARLQAAKAWSVWEGSTVKLIPSSDVISSFEDDLKALAMARIECHYFIHNCWLKEDQLIKDVPRIRNIPTWIVHGRYDVVCPVKNAWDLHKAFPEAKLQIIQDAGHAYDEPGILTALLDAANEAIGLI
ncbi:MAG: prolyl aminopeptidase [Candidatus Obscuribacterales bacterium]|nr:prolyl aminopeptidase [Candidatus Obscuribacterales bacterium]